MRKDEVVALMTKVINDMNRQRGIEIGAPLDQIDEMEQMGTPEFNRVNGLIYDMLVEYGIVR
jgi:hypothetical protein